MARTPKHQAAIDALKADTDRQIETARKLAGDDPELNQQLDEAIAEVEASREQHP